MTGAVVLMGVAVCAATGCVSVRGEDAPGSAPRTAPSRGAAVPQDGEDARPHTERPQLRETPSRPLPRRTAGGGAEETAPADRLSSAPSVGEAPPTGAEGGARAGADAPPGVPAAPGPVVRSPAVPELPGGPQMCDMGRRYGGWAEGSMPEEVCERAYRG